MRRNHAAVGRRNTTPAPPPTLTQKLVRWLGTAVGIVIGLVAITRLVVNYTVLPSCDSSRMTDTLRNIYRNQKAEFKGISDIKTVSSTSSEVTCTAVVDIGNDQEPISYRSYWDGWTTQVSVQPGPSTLRVAARCRDAAQYLQGLKVEISNITGAKTVAHLRSRRMSAPRNRGAGRTCIHHLPDLPQGWGNAKC